MALKIFYFRKSLLDEVDLLSEQIHSHPSYHGEMRKGTAEQRLKQHGGNCYLTRYSGSRSVYVISSLRVRKWDKKLAHFNIIIIREISSFQIKGSGLVFKEISKLYDYCQKNPAGDEIDCLGDYITNTPSHRSSNESITTGSKITRNHNICKSVRIYACEQNVNVFQFPH